LKCEVIGVGGVVKGKDTCKVIGCPYRDLIPCSGTCIEFIKLRNNKIQVNSQLGIESVTTARNREWYLNSH
jgi:hypothetical protein